jgi:YhcH/YjgK/YiaL family protein
MMRAIDRGYDKCFREESDMIVENISNWKIHFRNPVWEVVFAEIKLLNQHTPGGERKIQNDDVILKVFSYETVSPQDPRAELESHRKYIDIHMTIMGCEKIEWYPASLLTAKGLYNDEEDAIYYERKEAPAGAEIIMYPGIFAALWPEDAHMPRIMTDGKSELIKKAVCKINVDII